MKCDRCDDNKDIYHSDNLSEKNKLSKTCCTYHILCLGCINNLNDNLEISNMKKIIVIINRNWIIKTTE